MAEMATTETAYEELDMRCLAATTVAGSTRTLVEFRLTDWGLGTERHSALRQDVKIIIAELVANACEATPDREIRVRAVRDAQGVFISVWDSSNEMPQPRQVKDLELEELDLNPDNFDNNGGNGLALVIALAQETGFTPTTPAGKWVWARLTI
jgi:anti-sigma regulatory factor (Ser/Thr protein kinase)